MKLKIFLFVFSACTLFQAGAQELVSAKKEAGAFPVVAAGVTASIYVDPAEQVLVQKAAAFLQQDVAAVSGKKPLLTNTLPATAKNLVIVGSLQGSQLIQKLVQLKKLDAGKLKGQWEGYMIQVVPQPFKGIEQALVITGSDRRGTAYGVFALSQQMGVSPWYYWADVPVQKQKEIYVRKGSFMDAPKVKYRGIFINDEAPALSSWSKEQFGGFNHKFYEKVFELILRLRGNYLWPAMWGSAFYDDDPKNIAMADAYGIVIGTSHHEPLMRAHDEWRRYGSGKWNYDSNAVRLQEFWRGGMQRAANEKIVSIGMRGDGDEPMTRETATALLEKIVKDQRTIIEEVTGKPASQTPQLWALYKEVQDYYDKGMRVPDDVTLLLCDDNWGNIRKLPKLDERPRSGGYGIYYHFDYVGGPRNYKWLNTNNLARVWEQMHLAWEYNARQIWIVNVGDIKPMELPTSFFLDYAWNPERWNEDNLRTYYTQWAAKQFGPSTAGEIGDLLRLYAQLSARRKPELLDAATYSLHNYNEWGRVVGEWQSLQSRAEKMQAQLPAGYHDAYFQLVLHPIKAMANLHEMYQAVAWNHFHAANKNVLANAFAAKAKQHYLNDSLISLHYHKGIAGGKWNGMMSQTHIGYTYWQQPPVNKLPELQYVQERAAVNVSQQEIERQIDSLTNSANDTILKVMHSREKGTAGFYEGQGYVAIEAAHYTKAQSASGISWKVIPDIGRTGSGVSIFPVTAPRQNPGNGPYLSYEFQTHDSGKINLHTYLSPTLNFHNTEGLQFAVSIDDEAPRTMVFNKDDNNGRIWGEWVANNVIVKQSEHIIAKPGKHVLKLWAVTPGVVVQKFVLDLGGLKPSYLGPNETKN